MNELFVLLIPVIPMLLAIVSLFKRIDWLLLVAPIFTFGVALFVPEGVRLELPWLLLGSYWQLDQIAKLFLLFSSLIWFVGTFYLIREPSAVKLSNTYRCLFMLAMSGNLLLIIAAEMVSFYLGFAMMGLATYGLILKPSQQGRRAARVYLGFTLVGELALFTGMVLVFGSTESTLFADFAGKSLPSLGVGMILLGFGIKLALPGMHFWLPLVYTSAPVVTIAVLSGPMMKAGLLGWMRFLSPVADNLQLWGETLFWMGVLGAIWGFILAMMQRNANAVLAYSSISKMGFVSALFGYALVVPSQKEAILIALSLFAMHHLLLKPMLFLGLDNYKKRSGSLVLFLGLGVLALSMMAMPFSGGSAVKMEFAKVAGQTLTVFLVIAGLFSALMMLHFLYLLKPTQITIKPLLASEYFIVIWLLFIPIAFWTPFFPHQVGIDIKSLLAILVALMIYAAIVRLYTYSEKPAPWTKPGDLYFLFPQVRIKNPVYFRTKPQRVPFFSSSFHKVADLHNSTGLSLLGKGLLWLILFAVLLGSLVVANAEPIVSFTQEVVL